MFELLLQADRALADGVLDEAERIYWQLMDLDPTNAIAVAGLARVWLERGDLPLARTFAEQAIAIDPQNVAARRVIEALEDTGADHVGEEPPDLPLAEARRLEALSRRRGTESHEPAVDPAPSAGAKAGGAKRTASGKQRDLAGEPAGDAEPAAMQQPTHQAASHHVPHQAMPAGRQRFDAGEFRAPATDPYAAAEAAAVVEAVDALDESEEVAESGPGRVSRTTEVMGAVDATGAEASVAMRIALVADAADLEAAEKEAAETTAVEADVAGANAATEAVEADSAEPAERGTRSRLSLVDGADEPSAEDAEAQALREALAIVLGSEGETAPAEPGTLAGAAPRAASSTGRPEEPTPSGESASPNQAAPQTEAEPPAPRRKKSLFHRFRGS